ncbi:UDP-rhamnose:rhamnosyltransferase 1 [Pyrus ussuriensis x Pyrus communis]|uniref:UDP-rhamnose:rhamnosyltransferase 1 n=1 Tax=Pyrus ussuriensis x Pyrus communis TaxID=2448454 RepID=A0A5N5F4S1_9ROSA|nr:UDP-rhamnose:rhamnosyltransferase 1 [Pyrus ussuriensis x Pyrus communis]
MAKYLRVVMLPWSSFGHIIPYFQLSVALAKAKVHVSFISTPKNIQKLPKFSTDLQPFIHLVPIPFPPLDPGFLPEGAEATVDVPFEKTDNLKIAYDLLQKPIKQFVREQLPDWIISDYAAHWVVDITKEYGIPVGVFFGGPENLLGANRNHALPTRESLTSPLDWVAFPSTVAFREFEAGISDSARLAKIVSGSQVLAIRLLPPEKPTKRAKGGIFTDDGIFEWLDKHETRSVVLVGLLEDEGLAVEVKRSGDGSFSRDEISKKLRHAMVEEEGEKLRSNARKAAAVFGDHKLHQDRYLGQFVNFLKNNCTKRTP